MHWKLLLQLLLLSLHNHCYCHLNCRYNPIQGYTHPDYHILPYLRKKMIIIHYNNKWNRIYDYFTSFYVFTDSSFLYLVPSN